MDTTKSNNTMQVPAADWRYRQCDNFELAVRPWESGPAIFVRMPNWLTFRKVRPGRGGYPEYQLPAVEIDEIETPFTSHDRGGYPLHVA